MNSLRGMVFIPILHPTDQAGTRRIAELFDRLANIAIKLESEANRLFLLIRAEFGMFARFGLFDALVPTTSFADTRGIPVSEWSWRWTRI